MLDACPREERAGVSGFIEELKRRNVVRVAIAYAVTAWLLIEISATLEQTLRLPDWADTLLAFFLILGFPVAVFFSWAFEITPDGLKRESEIEGDLPSRAMTGRRLNVITVIMLALALGLFAFDRFGGETTQRPVPAVTEARDLSIAVLPFVNMSSDPEQEYFSDGLTEELLNLLAGISELEVAARTSSFFYKNKLDTIPLLEIARQLAVAHVLEGSVRRSGGKIRITAQLIEAETGFHLWSKTWDRELDDIFSIQDEIAANVADELRLTLLGDEGRSKVIDTQSLELAMQGRFFYNRRAEGDVARARERFEAAVAIDPRNATAWIGLVPLYYLWEETRDEEKFRTALNNALELEPDNPEVLIRYAQFLYWVEGRPEAAEPVWRRALELGSDNPLVLSITAGQACELGDIETCIDYQQRAVALDPLHLVNQNNLAAFYVWAWDYDAAEEQLRQTLGLFPGHISSLISLAGLRLANGRPEEAAALLGQVNIEDPANHQDGARMLLIRAAVRFSLGDQQEAELAFEEYIDTFGDADRIGLAALHAWRGETGQAAALLERAAASDEYIDLYTLRDPLLVSMHNDPAYRQLLDR
jgi:adenylate cyclase